MLLLFISVSLVSVAICFFHAKGDIEKFPSLFGYKPLTILSNSMKPTFSAGDVVLIDVNKSAHVNDVVTYKDANGILVTHRIVTKLAKEEETLFQTKGDNNNISDNELVPATSIVGIQRFVIPNVGYLAKFISRPIGFFIFVEIPIMTLIILEIFKRLGLIGQAANKRRKRSERSMQT